MKKPETSKKKRIASAKRGKKRSDRLKKTQKDKAKRKTGIQNAKKSKDSRFEQQMKNLFGQ